ncbi:MAG: UvrD-helicase domain-containing protein [Gammaproteobacteria bacterium]
MNEFVVADAHSPEALAAMDARAREHAIDPTQSILLRAPAGSGKTTVLTQRLLKLLATVEAPEEILAITFTRKAAAEMRERVFKALQGEIDPANPQAAHLNALAAAVRARDAQRGWGLEENPGRLRVQTIDSFNFWLASQLPIAAQAGGALVVAERPGELYRSAARRVLIHGESDQALAADIELLFERIDNRWGQVENLLSEMLAKRGHWLRYVLDENALSARVTASLADIAVEHLRSACTTFSQVLRNHASGLARVGPLGMEADHMVAWQQLATLTLTNEGTWRKQITRRLGVAFEQEEARHQLKHCIDLLSGVAGAQEMLITLTGLPASMLSGEDAQAIEALSRVLREAAKELHVEFSLAGKVDYTYVSGAAQSALVEEGLPTDLGLRTGVALRHVLIDEFQDTSIAQFELLAALTATWEPGDGHTLFAVGDPMQSIYLFREAEVGLFLRAAERGIGEVPVESLRLTRNFRSSPPLVAWTNALFTRLFPPNDDVRASAVAFTPSLAARDSRDEEFVSLSLSLFSNGEREAEAASIAARIRRIRDASAEGTVAILVVSRTHAPPIMAALASAGIEAIGVDLVPLRDISIVRDLVALLKALHHLGDRTAWLTVLRAPWCGLSLASLTELSARGDSQLIWEALFDAQRLGRCEEAETARATRVRAVLEEALATRERVDLAEWLEAVWMRLGAPDAYAADDLIHARAFFNALGSATARAEWHGPQDIEELVADLYAAPRAATPNPVQVMTIHRSKGLEFDHVFLPALDRILNRDRDPLLRWLDLPREGGGSDLLMAPVPTIGDTKGRALNNYLKDLDNARKANEQTRLLYVAMTRAKRSLHLSAAPKAKEDGTVVPRAGTLLFTLWPALGPEFVRINPGETAQPEVKVHKLRRLSSTWQPPAIEEGADRSRLPLEDSALALQTPEFSWVQETSRHIGTVVHRALERFGLEGELPSADVVRGRADEVVHQLRRLGVPEPDLERAVRTVLQALVRTLDDRNGRWVFNSAHREARSELALTGVADSQLTSIIIDRTFIDADGVRWVIDFKTSRHEGAGLTEFLDRELDRYRGQLERNMALARRLGPEPVKAALYFPLMGELRELKQKPEPAPRKKRVPPAQGELF